MLEARLTGIESYIKTDSLTEIWRDQHTPNRETTSEVERETYGDTSRQYRIRAGRRIINKNIYSRYGGLLF